MPRISEFYGITISIYYSDHAPPHFHAYYGGREALIAIDTLRVLRGQIQRRALALVREWAAARQHELQANWKKAEAGLPLDAIAPLD
ncbi:MAG: DUF4160 domain-containing protein [Deltaproteobacteria bacterium]|nr:DUF4160 domain-containing protein [Deltaproteobacteria bacterium]